MKPAATPAMTPSALLREWRVGAYTVRVARYAPHQRLTPHAHEEDSLTLVVQGSVVEEAGHASIAAGPGWSAMRPRGVSHTNRFGPQGAVVLGVFPLEQTFEELPRRWLWTGSARAYRAGLRLLGGEEEALTELMGEIEPAGRLDRGAACQARRLLEDQDAPIGEIARRLGLHPVYLARQFRAAYGLSLRDYRLVLRVRRAADRVLATGATLRRIAHECGFADQSHMCRVFRAVAGWSPGTLRAASFRAG